THSSLAGPPRLLLGRARAPRFSCKLFANPQCRGSASAGAEGGMFCVNVPIGPGAGEDPSGQRRWRWQAPEVVGLSRARRLAEPLARLGLAGTGTGPPSDAAGRAAVGGFDRAPERWRTPRGRTP